MVAPLILAALAAAGTQAVKGYSSGGVRSEPKWSDADIKASASRGTGLDVSFLGKYIREGMSELEKKQIENQLMGSIQSTDPYVQQSAAAMLNKLYTVGKTQEQMQSEQEKQNKLNYIKQYGYDPKSEINPVGRGNEYYRGDPRGYEITQAEFDDALGTFQQNKAASDADLANINAQQAKNPANLSGSSARENLNHERDVIGAAINKYGTDANYQYNGTARSELDRLVEKYGVVEPGGMYNANDVLNAIQSPEAKASPNSTTPAYGAEIQRAADQRYRGEVAQQTPQTQQGEASSGISPEALIQQLIDSVGQGQAQQESATREQFAQAQPALEQALNAALVRQSGGGRGGLDTGGMISAMAQQKQKGTVDLNKALADVANFYSTLKQNALGQALTGSLNIAQMGQQANQFGQTLAQNNAQQLQSTELSKYLAQLQAQQQNKQLSQTAEQFAKTFAQTQQNDTWTKQQEALKRQYALQDWDKSSQLAKDVAGMAPRQPEWSYWLDPLAKAVGSYAGTESGGTALTKLLGL